MVNKMSSVAKYGEKMKREEEIKAENLEIKKKILELKGY